MSKGSVLGEAGLVASVVAFHVADHRLVDERLHLVTHLGAGIAATAGAFALGADRSDLGLDADRLVPAVRAGLMAAAIPVGVLAGASFVSAFEPVLGDPRADHGSRARLGYRLALDIPIGTSVYEELVFRSALLGLALRHFSPPVAVAVSSALFGLWHVLPALEDRKHNEAVQRYPLVATVAPTVVSTAVAGVGFAALRLRAGHVVAPMIAHAVTNAAALLAATVVHRRRRRNGDHLERSPLPDVDPVPV